MYGVHGGEDREREIEREGENGTERKEKMEEKEAYYTVSV